MEQEYTTPVVPFDDWQFVCEMIDKGHWIFAKTMPENPHYYMLRKECEDGDFVRFVKIIRRYGYQYIFAGKPYTQLNVYDWFYWTMGAPVEETILINRKERRLADNIPDDSASKLYAIKDAGNHSKHFPD
jgi:hypothetical protein